jgi:hypothetical protein
VRQQEHRRASKLERAAAERETHRQSVAMKTPTEHQINETMTERRLVFLIAAVRAVVTVSERIAVWYW